MWLFGFVCFVSVAWGNVDDLYATSPGAVALNGEGRNSVFTKHLLKQMPAPGLPVEQVLKQARVGVMQETNGQQLPWESSSLLGEFFFVK